MFHFIYFTNMLCWTGHIPSLHSFSADPLYCLCYLISESSFQVHDRAQVFISCPEDSGKRPTYVDVITRQTNRPIYLPYIKCASKNKLFILVWILSLSLSGKKNPLL